MHYNWPQYKFIIFDIYNAYPILAFIIMFYDNPARTMGCSYFVI